eukprot:1416154-Rhodomonas_salina.1
MLAPLDLDRDVTVAVAVAVTVTVTGGCRSHRDHTRDLSELRAHFHPRVHADTRQARTRGHPVQTPLSSTHCPLPSYGIDAMRSAVLTSGVGAMSCQVLMYGVGAMRCAVPNCTERWARWY